MKKMKAIYKSKGIYIMHSMNIIYNIFIISGIYNTYKGNTDQEKALLYWLFEIFRRPVNAKKNAGYRKN